MVVATSEDWRAYIAAGDEGVLQRILDPIFIILCAICSSNHAFSPTTSDPTPPETRHQH
jgi:hypothetical protein